MSIYKKSYNKLQTNLR